MKKIILLISSLLFVLLVGGFFFVKNAQAPEKSSHDETIEGAKKNTLEGEKPAQNPSTKNPRITIETTKGTILLELFMDKTPITAGNFIKLAEAGFYDGTKFHRVIKNFMIQGGDPNSRSDNTALYGRGSPGYTIQDEFVTGLSNVRGTIAMANTGQPNSGGSQFFINAVDNIGLDFDKPPLTSSHPVFGKVLDGLDVVDAIVSVPTGPGDIPITPLIIKKITLFK